MALYVLVNLYKKSLFLSDVIIIVGSLLFYATFGSKNLSILLIPLIIDYFLGRQIGNSTGFMRKVLFVVGIVINILLLGYFKYSHFFVAQIASFFPIASLKNFLSQSLIIPVGISFITFQRISYLTDIYRKKTVPEKNPIRYAVYALIFPHLIAGPIVRYVDIKNELRARVFSHENFYIGMKLFAIGLFLKVFIADQLFLIEEHLISMLSSLSSLLSMLLILCFSLRLYFDFLGYSLMAIGIASILGFHFPDNFNSPYTSTSITVFWRRWNMTLSQWIRDYVYIPLGGNKKGEIRTYINILASMFLAGLWHGAGWNYVIWGTFHGIFMVIERYGMKLKIHLPYRLRQLITFIVVSFLWIVFRFTKLEDLKILLGNLSQLTFFDISQLTHNKIMAALPAFVIGIIWIVAIKEIKLRQERSTLVKLFLYALLLFGTIMFSLTQRTIGFIYFQF